MITICKNKKIVSYMLHAYYLLPMLILSCLAFNTEDGKHYISRLVVAMFIISLFTARKILWSNLNNPEIKRIMFFWILIAVVFAGYHIFRGEVFSAPRAILVSLLYLLVVPWHRIQKQMVLLVILFGGCVAGAVGLYEYAVLDIRRVGGVINQIPFALYVAITLLIAIYTVLNNQNRNVNLLVWLSIIGSVFAIVMSEVRGVWLALIFTAIILVCYQLKKWTVRRMASMAVVALAMLVLLSLIPAIEQRVDETRQEITQISAGNKDTSIGIRLQLWHSAIEIIKAHPLMGVGTKGYQNIMEQQYQQGVITSAVLSFKNAHYHNQYLDSYVRYGVPGLLIVFVIFMSPYLLYGLQCTSQGFLCISISSVCLIAGLTDVPLIHTGIIYVIILYSAVIYLTSCDYKKTQL